MLEVRIDQAVASELERPVHFGPVDEQVHLDEGGFVGRVADQPVAFRLRDALGKLSLPLPKEAAELYNQFDVWMIPHRVGIFRERGWAEPVSVGIEVKYVTDGETCAVVSLLPAFEYIEPGGIGGDLKVHGRLSPTGEAAPSDHSAPSFTPLLRHLGLEFGLSGGMEMSFRFSGNVATPRIAAVGIGASRCQWRLDRHKEPLFDRDIETWTVLALSKWREQIEYDVRFYINTRTVWFTTRRESDWVRVTCPLVGA